MPERQIVHRIEDGMDRREVACTTYQMRNFYTQLRDGYFSRLDTFNYASHHQIAKWAAQGAEGKRVLDVCCGRGLLLPLLRYHAPKIGSYTGLDIKATNATWRTKRVTDGKPLGAGLPGHRASQPDAAGYYPFGTYFVEGNVAEADRLCREQECPGEFDFIVYTASIEHMHPEDGQRSLHALRAVAAPDAQMVLTCPNTPAGQDGYDTRYRAHVYEWSLNELQAGLEVADWEVLDTWGLDMGVRELQAAMDAEGLGGTLARIRQFVPPEWVVPVLAPLFPEASAEVGLLCRPTPPQHALFS